MNAGNGLAVKYMDEAMKVRQPRWVMSRGIVNVYNLSGMVAERVMLGRGKRSRIRASGSV